MLRYGRKSVDQGAAFYETQYRIQQLIHLKRATQLGLQDHRSCPFQLSYDDRLSAGVESGFFQSQLATKQWTATTEVRLGYGHQGTKQIRTIAVELGRRDSAEGLASTKHVSATMDPQGRPRTQVIVHTYKSTYRLLPPEPRVVD